MLEGFATPVALVRTDHRILAANEAYRERFRGGSQVCGQTCHAVSHRLQVPCDEVGERCPLRIAERTGQPAKALHAHRVDGFDQLHRVTAHPLFEDSRVWACLEIHNPTPFTPAKSTGEAELVGRSTSFRRMFDLIDRVAPTSSTVLLLGESGTGKELVARAIHRLSPRAARPFVPVECSGLTETLFESELFGHEKGAFTGAYGRKIGLVEAANHGTLFLDEIGDIPPALQVKLLRLLETRIFRRVGSVQEMRSEFRLVCATHRDLESMVEQGEFRQDLYYRLNTFPIRLPPLRERQEDIPLLAEHIFERLGCAGRCRLDPAATAALSELPFPGNVRELRNLLERACLLSDDGLLHTEHFDTGSSGNGTLPEDVPFPLDSESVLPIDAVESRYVRWLCQRFSGNRAELASLLGISERTLYRKLHEG
jgi:DNA-binding NtrC family response regulator